MMLPALSIIKTQASNDFAPVSIFKGTSPSEDVERDMTAYLLPGNSRSLRGTSQLEPPKECSHSIPPVASSFTVRASLKPCQPEASSSSLQVSVSKRYPPSLV